MNRAVKLSLVAAIPVLSFVALVLRSRASFPKETTPEGAYARVVVAITTGRPRDCFAYLETQAQWAA